MTTQQFRAMTSRPGNVVAWTVGGVALATAALLGAGLHALGSGAAFVVLGVLAGLALVGGLVCWFWRSPPQTPLQDTLRGSADRLRLLESAVIHAHDAIVVLGAQP